MEPVTAIAWGASAVLAAIAGAVVGPWIRQTLRRREMQAREQREMIEEWLELSRFKVSHPAVVLMMVDRGEDPQQAARWGLAAFIQSTQERTVRWPLDPARVRHKMVRQLCHDLNQATNNLTMAMVGLASGGSPETFAKVTRDGLDRAQALRETIIEEMVKAGW